ncbi:MAG: polysaccharide deacetylase family protein [Patulibacter sp.]|nr:polysaccharide deacetylase family protein [Patulibacter sp.]
MPRPLYLTFDDGPDPKWTPRVLDLLARHDAAATFFVLGWRVRERPDLVREILDAGHRVELHGDAHLDHEASTPQQLADDTLRALDELGKCGVVPQWWRVPFSRAGRATLPLAERHGLRIASWDADSFDWRGDSWADQSTDVAELAALGGVIQLHDAVQLGMPRGDARNTLEITEELLEAAHRHGTPVLAFPPASTDEPIRDTPRQTPFARSQKSVRQWKQEIAAAEAARRRSSDRGL